MITTTPRSLLSAWAGLESVDLSHGRKAELEKLATTLAEEGSVVIPARTVRGLAGRPTQPVAQFTGLETLAAAAAVATLFAVGYTLGTAAGTWYRGKSGDEPAVKVKNEGTGDVEVTVGGQ